MGFGEIGVKGIGNVCGQAEGLGQAVLQTDALGGAEVIHEILEEMALHAGDTHTADLFLVCQDADSGLCGGAEGEHGSQLCVSADPVVVAVGADQAPVQANLAAGAGGNDGQFGAEEILLDDAVLFVQQLHNVQLHQVAALTLQGLGAQQQIQLLTGNDLAGGLLHLLAAQVDQQIGDHQHGIAGILADGDGDLAAVLAADQTVESQGHGDPLILLDAAVIVGLQESHLRIFIEGVGLYVDPGRVNVGSADIGTLCQRFATHNRQNDGLIPVVKVDLVTGGNGHAGSEGLEALLLGFCHSPGGCFPFGLAGVDERHIFLREQLHGGPVIGGDPAQTVLGCHQQLLAQLFNGHMYILRKQKNVGGRRAPSYIIAIVSKNATHFVANASKFLSFTKVWSQWLRNHSSLCWAAMRLRA